jgi:hypothetical protein
MKMVVMAAYDEPVWIPDLCVDTRSPGHAQVLNGNRKHVHVHVRESEAPY